MSLLDDRKNAFENKFAHDTELQFKVESRRNKLIALWAADLLEKNSDEAENYVIEVIKSDFEEAGDEDVFRKVSGDLGDKATEDEIKTKMSELLAVAKSQVMESSD